MVVTVVLAVALLCSGAVPGTPPVGAPRAAAAPRPAAPVAQATYRWPLDGQPRVLRRFDPPPQPWLAGHRGVDLAAGPAAVVRAAGAGEVRFAGRIAGRGVVSIEHAGGLRTTYEPLTPSVRTGQAVSAGAPIGLLSTGHEGCPAPACLHWGLRRGEAYLDPLSLLAAGRVRLLPLDGAAAYPGVGAVGATSNRQRGFTTAGSRSASRSYSSARL